MTARRLHANENPWGASRRVDVALGNAVLAHYPDVPALEDALAARLGIDADRIVLGNGSTELIGLLVLALCGPAEAVAVCRGSFVAYRQLCAAAGRRLQLAEPLPEGGTDLNALADVVDASTRLVFIANPDNPSGTMCTAADLDAFLARLPTPGPLVVLDEAYREYVAHRDYPSATRYLDDPRVAVLRTFSKVHGLAGLRCGYLVAAPDLARRVARVAGPFRVGRPTRAAAHAALLDEDHVALVVRNTRTERARLRGELLQLGLVVPESHASFVMAHLGRPADPVRATLARRGIQVRDLGAYGWPHAVRVTVGRLDDNLAACAALAHSIGGIPCKHPLV